MDICGEIWYKEIAVRNGALRRESQRRVVVRRFDRYRPLKKCVLDSHESGDHLPPEEKNAGTLLLKGGKKRLRVFVADRCVTGCVAR